ncbi:MAG: DUF4249 family protein [Cyclobacteriaceae bacterium]
MMRQRIKPLFKILIFPLAFIAASCVTEFDPNIKQTNKRLVVEGRMTTEPGPYFVKLSQTEDLRFSFADSLFAPASNAVVIISDSENNSETLVEVEPGLYRSAEDGSGIRGAVGGIYQLTVITQEDNFYQSIPQEILPPVEMDSIYVLPESNSQPPLLWENEVLDIPLDSATWVGYWTEDFSLPVGPDRLWETRRLRLRNTPNELLDRSGFIIGSWVPQGAEIDTSQYPLPGDPLILSWGTQFPFVKSVTNIGTGYRAYAEYRDPPGERNYYKWNVRGIFGVNTQPQFWIHRGRRPFGLEVIVNYPKDCCSQCWVTVAFPNLFVGNDAFKDGAAESVDLSFINFNEFYFDQAFYVEIEQESLNFQAYQFFNAIAEQADDVGGLFDPAPALLLSNIINPDDEEDLVLGYFTASSVSIKRQLIVPSEAENRFLRDNPFRYPDDCRTLVSNQLSSTTNRPDFF